jgi:adenylate kinase
MGGNYNRARICPLRQENQFNCGFDPHHQADNNASIVQSGKIMQTNFDNIIVMGKSGAGKQPRVDVLTRWFGLKQLSTGDIFRHYLGLFGNLNYTGDLADFYDADKGDFIPDEEIQVKLDIAGQPTAEALVLGLKAKYYVNQGLFVPDRITNALFEGAFQAMGFLGAVLDGFPRTKEQAQFLVELVEREGVKLDAILLVENDDDLIIKRTVGRRICRTCGELFHIDFRPPPEDREYECQKKCDIFQRSDDTVESLRARLNEFKTKTQPAIDFLRESSIPFYTVSGNLPNYSKKAVESSVLKAMNLEKAETQP